MNRIKVPVIARWASLALMGSQAVAVAADTVLVEEIQVVSSATRTEQPIDGVTASVVVIDRRDIEKSGAQSLKDIINATPGLIVQYGTFPAASSASKSSLSIRGVGPSGTLWLIDGRRLSGEVKNPYDMDRLPASSIDRIEIVKGPMSALYGADAVGGVINIITKKPKDAFSATASVRYGVNQDGDAANTHLNASVRGGIDRVRYSLYASTQSTDPYTETENTATRIGPQRVLPTNFQALPNANDTYPVEVTYREESTVNTVGGRLEADLTDKLLAGIEFNWFDEEREGNYRANFHPTAISPAPGRRVPAWDVPVLSEDNNERLDLGADLAVDINDNLLWKLRYYKSGYEKRNDTSMLEFEDFGFASQNESKSSGMNANVDINAVESYVNWSVNEQHLITAGGEVRDEEREATVFSQSNDFNKRSVAYQAFYLQDEWTVSDSVNINLAGRHDRYEQDSYVDALGQQRESNDDSESTFRIGLLKKFHPQANLRLNFGQGYRVPDIRELFIQKQTPAGLQLGAQAINPDVGKEAHELTPETTDSVEVGLFGDIGQLRYEVNVFQNAIDDHIQQVAVDVNGDQNSDYFTFRNVSEVTTKGLELNLRYALSDALDGQFFWTELDTENKDTGKDLEFTPERIVSAALGWEASEQLALQLKATYTGEQNYFENGADQTTSAFTLVDLTTNYKPAALNGFELFGGINNAFDESVDKRLGSNVGRFYFLGLRAHFE